MTGGVGGALCRHHFRLRLADDHLGTLHMRSGVSIIGIFVAYIDGERTRVTGHHRDIVRYGNARTVGAVDAKLTGHRHIEHHIVRRRDTQDSRCDLFRLQGAHLTRSDGRDRSRQCKTDGTRFAGTVVADSEGQVTRGTFGHGCHQRTVLHIHYQLTMGGTGEIIDHSFRFQSFGGGEDER